jgi:hypothetical protein
MIWSILAPDFDEPVDEESEGPRFVQIEGFGGREKKPD